MAARRPRPRRTPGAGAGLHPVYVRYNSGLHLAQRACAGRPDRALLAAWPVPVGVQHAGAQHGRAGGAAPATTAPRPAHGWLAQLRRIVFLVHAAPWRAAGACGPLGTAGQQCPSRPFARLGQLRSSASPTCATAMCWTPTGRADRFRSSPTGAPRAAARRGGGASVWLWPPRWRAAARLPGAERLLGDGLVPLHSARPCMTTRRAARFPMPPDRDLHQAGHLICCTMPAWRGSARWQWRRDWQAKSGASLSYKALAALF